MTLAPRIKQAALESGFDFAAVAPFAPPGGAGDLDHYLARGYAAGMPWLARDPERRKDPRLLWPEGRSILVVGINYRQQPLPPETLADPSRGRIASYAWGRDYHDILLPRLRALGGEIDRIAGRRVAGRAYVDTGPLLEKPIAAAAHAGFLGKNTLLIRPRFGSFHFLGELLLALELPVDPPPRVESGCGDCALCEAACPTGALEEAYRLNAPRCISYLTIEHRGPIPRELRPKMGNWIFGCDACQTCCPYNAHPAGTTREEALRPTDPEQAAPKLLELIALDEEGFRARFRGSAVKRVKRSGLLRNVAVALGNWGGEAGVEPLGRALDDPEPLVRGHAAWALGRIGTPEARAHLARSLAREADPLVRGELTEALAGRLGGPVSFDDRVS